MQSLFMRDNPVDDLKQTALTDFRRKGYVKKRTRK